MNGFNMNYQKYLEDMKGARFVQFSKHWEDPPEKEEEEEDDDYDDSHHVKIHEAWFYSLGSYELRIEEIALELWNLKYMRNNRKNQKRFRELWKVLQDPNIQEIDDHVNEVYQDEMKAWKEKNKDVKNLPHPVQVFRRKYLIDFWIN